MSDLLPPNATPAERALSEAMARIADVPVIVKQVWNADTAPANVLPWLAWAFSVDDWDVNWTDQQKRNVIKKSILSQRIKGTIGAVRQQLSALGVEVEVIEWFNQVPQGAPYTFAMTITTSQEPLDKAGIANILKIVETNKNLRSHLTSTTVVASSESEVFTAAVTNIGNEISLTNYVSIDVSLNDFNAVNNVIYIGD
jgi:phage tail P2-like protein